MNEYNTKNYTEQGGEVTHIGGKLIFEEGAQVEGLPSANAVENQANSSASQVSGLRSDFNALLAKLKDAGVMTPDAWQLTAALAPSPTEAVVAENNALVQSVTFTDDIITINVDVDALTESASSVPEQGTHKWLCLGIGTGLGTITDAKYNGTPLTEQDVSDATACGCPAGTFVLYIKAEVVAEEGKTFTLKADGYPEEMISVVVISE